MHSPAFKAGSSPVEEVILPLSLFIPDISQRHSYIQESLTSEKKVTAVDRQ